MHAKTPPINPPEFCPTLTSFPTIWFWHIFRKEHIVKVFCIKAWHVNLRSFQNIIRTGKYLVVSKKNSTNIILLSSIFPCLAKNATSVEWVKVADYKDTSDVSITLVSVAKLRRASVGDVKSKIKNGNYNTIINKHSLYSLDTRVFTKLWPALQCVLWGILSRFSNWHKERVINWVKFSEIMYIIWGIESVLGLKTFPDHRGNLMCIEIIPTNNNLFVIGIIDFNERVLNICSQFFPRTM